MAHGLNWRGPAQTVAEEAGREERAPLGQSEMAETRAYVGSVISPRTGATLAQSGADRRSADASRQCASYPPKGGLTGRSPAHAPASELNWRNEPIHDLTSIFSPETAAIICEAWVTHRDQADPEPIREHYRQTTHQGLRALLAQIMTGGRS